MNAVVSPNRTGPNKSRSAGWENAGQEDLISVERLAEALSTVCRLYPDIPVIAIQWMHLKNHLNPIQEGLLRGNEGDSNRPLAKGRLRAYLEGLGVTNTIAWRIGLCILHAVHLSLVLVRLRWTFRWEIGALKRRRFDLVAKTWCFGPNPPPGDRDFYYGDLQSALAERGVHLLLLCGDASGADLHAFAEANVSVSSLGRLPELCLVSPLVPLLVVFKQWLSSLRLRGAAARAADPLFRRISLLASRECLSPSTMRNTLFFWIAKAAVKAWQPCGFMTLYEGHGWEKCAWQGAKAASPSCRTIGYQHTVVHQYNFAQRCPPSDPSNQSLPDIVLCTGETTKRMLQPGHSARSKIIEFGTFRVNTSNGTWAAPQPAKATVLVLPEGILREAKLLFDFAAQVASFMPDHHFIFRCHPVLPFDQVLPYLEVIPEKFHNIEVSLHEAIADDFSRSSVVLYRGSSAVLYAVRNGLKPIYLNVDCHPNVDPLFELTSWRERVSSSGEMECLLRRYAAASSDCVSEEWQNATEYVSAYTMAVDDVSINRFLEVLGLSERG